MKTNTTFIQLNDNDILQKNDQIIMKSKNTEINNWMEITPFWIGKRFGTFKQITSKLTLTEGRRSKIS